MQELLITIVLLFELLLCALMIYSVYKLIWYMIKLLHLCAILQKFKSSIKVESSIFDIIFHRKRAVDLTIDKRDVKYEVFVLSFISTQGRWNIEKERKGYSAEARRKNLIFYKNVKHSGTSEFASEFSRESRFQRIDLNLIKDEVPNTKKILLVYPRPKTLTYAHTKLEYLRSGSIVEGYEIMYLGDLLKLI